MRDIRLEEKKKKKKKKKKKGPPKPYDVVRLIRGDGLNTKTVVSKLSPGRVMLRTCFEGGSILHKSRATTVLGS